MIQDFYHRGKRDSSSSGSDSSSSGSDDSSSSDSSSSSSNGDNTTPVDECALLGDYIATDLATLPANFNKLLDITLIAQAQPAFSALLTSAPTLFASLSTAVDAAANQITIPPSFNAATNRAAQDAMAALSSDFVALADDSCGIALSTDQIQKVNGLFRFVLPSFVFFQQDCNILSVPILERGIAASVGGSPVGLQGELSDAAGIFLFVSRRLHDSVIILFRSTPDDQVTAVAQALLDEFLFYINDFCGIPPLSSTAMTQLSDYFLVYLVNRAT